MSDHGEDQNDCVVYRPRVQNDKKGIHKAPNKPSPTQLRAFESVWLPVHDRLKSVLLDADTSTVSAVSEFLSSVEVAYSERIPTGLINASASGSLFDRISQSTSRDFLLLRVPSSQCVNLKTACRCVMSTVETDSGVRLLNYDLQGLQTYVTRHSIKMVVLCFENGESLEGNFLSELVDLLSSWKDRIPLAVLLEIAVSVDLFQEKLSRRTAQQLRATVFEAKAPSEILDLLFRAATTASRQTLWLGFNVATMLLDRQAEHVQSAKAFVQAIKYVHMIHFFTCPVSVLLISQRSERLERQQCEYLRDTSSFAKYTEELLEEKNAAKANKLQKDDRLLHQTVVQLLQQSQESLREMSDVLEAMICIHTFAQSKTALTWSKLYVQAMAGKLKGSALMSELLLSVQSMSSDLMSNLLDKLSTIKAISIEVEKIRIDLADLVNSYVDAKGPLRGEHDVRRDILRTTVVAQKVELSRHKATLSKHDAEFSRIVSRVDLMLRAFFIKYLINPKELYFSEIFFFDSKGALREAFSPLPRHAVERALEHPGAYLACECCEEKDGPLTSSQPTTAILYQLYLESGALINVSDLWSAFKTIVSSETEEQGSQEDRSQSQVLALFYRALAELRYLGMIKASRKRADHLTKLKWQGL